MVVLSSCTNYDDQFDDLNTQINSLKSQIEGFNSLSSGLTSLQGTVAALQTAVNALPKTATPATDISGLEASVAALQAALSGAATSAEVAALTADLAATQTALDASIAANATATAAAQTALEAALATAQATNTTATDAITATLAELEADLAAAATAAEVAAISTSIAANQAALVLAIGENATAAADNATEIEALATSLAELTKTIAAIQASLLTVSTAEEVANLAADLEAAQVDLDVLIAQSSFYTGNLSITSVSELAFANSLGNKVNIIQGSLTITQNEDMDVTTLTAVMSKFRTVTLGVTYTSTSSATTQVPFANLISAGGLTISQAGDISLPKLTTVNGDLSITGQDGLNDDFTKTVSLPLLTSVTKAVAPAATMTFGSISKATTFSMPSMVEFDGPISISIANTGSTVDISKFKNDTDLSTGLADAAPDALIVNAATLTAPVYVEGQITGTKVVNVSLPLWEGSATSRFVDADTVVLPSIKANSQGEDYVLNTMFPNANSIHIVGNTRTTTAATPDTYEITVTATSQDEVDSLILTGTFEDVTLSGNTDLRSLTFDAKAENFELNNSDLVTADITVDSAAANKDALTSVKITNNLDLESIIVNKANNLNNFQVNGNIKLANASFPDLDTSVKSATVGVKVDISNNDFSATKTESIVAAKSVYKVTSTSKGVQDLKKFLSSAITNRDKTVALVAKIDKLTPVDKLGAVGTPANTFIVNLKDAVVTTPGSAALTEIRAWTVPNNGTGTLQILVGSDAIFRNSSNVATPIALSSNMTLAMNELKTGASRASDLGLVLSAQVGANVADIEVEFYLTNDSATTEYAGSGAASNTTIDLGDVITFKIGSQEVTTTVLAGDVATANQSSTEGIAAAIKRAWEAKYDTGVQSTLYTIDHANATDHKITIGVNSLTGNRAHGDDITFSVANDTGVYSGTVPVVGYTIGTKVTTDNELLGTDVILTLENADGAVAFPGPITFSGTLSGTTGVMTTTDNHTAALATNGATKKLYPTEARGIARLAKDKVDAVDDGSELEVNNTTWL